MLESSCLSAVGCHFADLIAGTSAANLSRLYGACGGTAAHSQTVRARHALDSSVHLLCTSLWNVPLLCGCVALYLERNKTGGTGESILLRHLYYTAEHLVQPTRIIYLRSVVCAFCSLYFLLFRSLSHSTLFLLVQQIGGFRGSTWVIDSGHHYSVQ